MKNTDTEITPESKKSCCRSTHFWMWAALRITVVVALIVGAFFLGTRYSHNRSYDKGNLGGHGAMMMGERAELRDTDRKGGRAPVTQDAPMTHDPMNMSMSDMGQMLSGKTGEELNKTFIEMMIPHHQAAVEMAQYLAASDKPELVKLGADIITAQSAEIEQMQQWMIDWGYTTREEVIPTETASGDTTEVIPM